MVEDLKRSMTVRLCLALGDVLPVVALLGGGLTGIVYWSRLPTSASRDMASSPEATASVAPEASTVEAEPRIAAEPSNAPVTVELDMAPTQSKFAPIYAAAPSPPISDGPSKPSLPAASPAPLASRSVPLPVPRPPEFQSRKTPPPARRVATRRAPLGTAAPPEDTRSFIEKLFGMESSEAPRLAYAALETKAAETVFRRALNAVPRGRTGGVAIYDIRAKVVTLPNGEKLEAHSGLGESMDDPGHVHVRMKGPTPVGIYDMSEREQPFHGVRALRLNPLGGPEAVHGRVGLLAHTYLLGPNGASNGCVSFKDYDKFLQAHLRGDIQRLVVIAGS